MASGEIVIRAGAVLTGDEDADMTLEVVENITTYGAQVQKQGARGRPAILAWRVTLWHQNLDTGEWYALSWRVHVDDVTVLKYDNRD